jgi:hypothetical protein
LIGDLPGISFVLDGKLLRIQVITNDLLFEILLKGPEKSQTQVICTTVNSFPSVCDGRNLLSEQKTPQFIPSTSELINLLPSLSEKVLKNDQFGSFQLLSLYPLEIWSKPSMNWFYCTEIDVCNPKRRKNRVLVVTHSHLLVLSPHQTKPLAVLIFWAELFALSSVQRSKTDENSIILEWKLESESTFQQFKLSNSKLVTKLISGNLSRLGSIPSYSFLVEIEENEDRFKVFEVLRKIERCERLLETIVDDEKLLDLIALYQKAIEYLSAGNDSRAEVYIKKLQALFNDVRVLKQIFSEMRSKESKTRIKNQEKQKSKSFDERKGEERSNSI